MQINATHKDSGFSRSVIVDFGGVFVPGDTMEKMIDKFGERPIVDAAIRSFVIAIQGHIRLAIGQALDKKEPLPTNESLQLWAGSWKPGTRKARLSDVEKTKKAIDNLTDEQRAELIREYNEALQAE